MAGIKSFFLEFDADEDGQEEKKNEERHGDFQTNEKIVKSFGKLILLKESKQFLEKYPELVSMESMEYIINWSIKLETDEVKFSISNSF